MFCCCYTPDGLRNVPPEGCRMTATVPDYHQNQTTSGELCENWMVVEGKYKANNITTSHIPHNLSGIIIEFALFFTTVFNSTFNLGDHNYCRNPNDDPGGAWCYVKVTHNDTTTVNVTFEYERRFCDTTICGKLSRKAYPIGVQQCCPEHRQEDLRTYVTVYYIFYNICGSIQSFHTILSAINNLK